MFQKRDPKFLHVELGENTVSLRSSSKFQNFCLLKVFTELLETRRSNKDNSKRQRKGGVTFIDTIRVLYL